MPTKDELEQENAELRARVAELEAGAEREITGTGTTRPRPQRPTDDDGNPVLSEGERQELAARGVATSPFDGSTLNALDEGVEVTDPEARRRAERARTEHPAESSPNDWPLSGPPPAGGGDVDATRS